MSLEDSQKSSSSSDDLFLLQQEQNDLFQHQQETILGTHFQKQDIQNVGRKVNYPSEYIDSLFTKEFTNLTVQERSRTYEEIHGVSDCIDETPALVEDCLSQLDEELSRLPEKEAYDMAMEQNKAYATDEKFRLMFLRASCFHPRKAAVRLVPLTTNIRLQWGRELQYA